MDIVDRLFAVDVLKGLCADAAEEIQRLRAEVAASKCVVTGCGKYDGGEVRRLRELLRVLRRNPHIEEILRWDANLAYLDRIDAALKDKP